MAPLTDISRALGQQQGSAEPISRTMQYRKVTKPLLERQRRARINRCLDELKEILVSGLQNDGENVARLEKADILELTVRHMTKLQQQHNKMVRAQSSLGHDDKFRNGFAHCAQEVSRVLATTPKIDVQLGSSIMVHLGHTLNKMANPSSPPVSPGMTRPSSSCSNASNQSGDYRPYTPPASPTESQLPQMSPLSLTVSHSPASPTGSCVWRPW
ncbi:unnamed protein product [Orchesella dallaii]|uniref:Uncharacterized protein n=1 Tax=Orchesella dallaii TaxID=48710 RepID=A0ABP1QA27_9HEXA